LLHDVVPQQAEFEAAARPFSYAGSKLLHEFVELDAQILILFAVDEHLLDVFFVEDFGACTRLDMRYEDQPLPVV